MESFERDVRTYETEEGYVPFNDWLSRLKDLKARAIIRARINRIRLGLLGDWKSVGDGVYELRISYGSGYRIYFGQDGQTIIILLFGGDKKTQKQDISQAKIYWQDYRRRIDG
ncbi:type II toxin-antitoxin system RelE/ParE family toxin [Crocosphaera sp. Alani8]|uniref:type II toxin-antitoxin system RelE/ParE family toxin n=1 Tax=Crocosphaera sp. Alani8 TaxID=3038952 RepID=UPI00313C712B